jgi:glycosyltransferase involved in cell wall biosynthesis
MSTPKVIHVITRLIVGGAQENTILSCKGLRDLGYDVTLVTGPETGSEGSLIERARAMGIPVVVLDSLRRNPRPILDLVARHQLKKLFRREKPDIVHTHSSKAGILGRMAAKKAGVPVIIHTNHGLPFHDRQSWIVNRFWRFLERRVAPATTKFVCVGETMKRQSIEAGLAPPERHEVVYSGIETSASARARPTGAAGPVIGGWGDSWLKRGRASSGSWNRAVASAGSRAQIVGDGPWRPRSNRPSRLSRGPRASPSRDAWAGNRPSTWRGWMSPC